MNSQRRLGRGLEALLGRPLGAADGGEQVQPGAQAATGPPLVSVYQIETNPFQPRRDFDEEAINELCDSIKEHGLLQPLVVRRNGERYQLVAGERRLRAAIKAGWAEVPVQIRDADDRQMAELAIVENLQRKDLNPLEKAASFQDYLQRYGCTQEELAGRLKIDRSTVANLIRLLELPEAVQHALRSGAITQGHARALLPLGDEREQVAFCERIQTETLSVRAIEEMVQEIIRHQDGEPLSVVSADGEPAPRVLRPRSEQLAALEHELRSTLGTKVDLKQTAKGRGRIVIHFSNHEEFERLRAHVCGQPHMRAAG